MSNIAASGTEAGLICLKKNEGKLWENVNAEESLTGVPKRRIRAENPV
jgi:hypothetical protein